MKKTSLLIILIGISTGLLFFGGCQSQSDFEYRYQVAKAIENHDLVTVESLVVNSTYSLNGSYVFWMDTLENTYNRTPLQLACYEGNIEIVKVLVENGADPNYMCKSSNLCSALMEVARTKQLKNRFELLEFLLDNGANINYASYEKSTVLDYMVENPYKAEEDISILQHLEARGADLSPKSNPGVLFGAVMNDNVSILEFLVKEKNYNINSTTLYGSHSTPLIFYCYNNPKGIKSTETIAVLLALGADKSAKNDEGKTAYDYAKENRYEFSPLLKP